MIDDLLNSLKGQVGDSISDEGLGMDKLDDVLKLSGDSVKNGVMSEVTGGNLDGVISLFKGDSDTSSSNPIISGIVSNLTEKLTSSLGLGDGIAGSIADKVVPMIISAAVSKFSGSDNGASAEGIASFFGGGDGLLDQAKGMLGGLFS
ncbi:MAG: hypothetical protein MK081_07540 [Flavobacteriales bacterium]|nr:hypothetical protein [Flavobacteriales bacterium]